jgi:hypothetical protein
LRRLFLLLRVGLQVTQVPLVIGFVGGPLVPLVLPGAELVAMHVGLVPGEVAALRVVLVGGAVAELADESSGAEVEARRAFPEEPGEGVVGADGLGNPGLLVLRPRCSRGLARR